MPTRTDVQTDVHIVPVDSDSPIRNLLKVQTVRCALALYKGNYIPSPAPIFNIKGPWTKIQVTVSKRLTFWNRSLTSYGLDFSSCASVDDYHLDTSHGAMGW